MEVGEEFSGGGDEGDFGGFAGGAQAGVEGLEGGMMTGGGEGAEGENAADFGAAAVDVTHAAEGSAVVIARSQAGQAGKARGAALAEFGQEGEEGDGSDETDAGSLLQTGGFGGEGGLGVEVLFNEGFDLFEPLLQGREALVEIAAEDFFGGGFAVLLFAAEQLGELVAAGDEGGEDGNPLGRDGRGRGREERADAGESLGVERSVFGHATQAAGELAGARGVEHAHGQGGLPQRGDDGAFVAARRFADDLHGAAVRGDPGHERGVARGVVFEGEEDAGEMAGEGGLGDIEAEVDERWSHDYIEVVMG